MARLLAATNLSDIYSPGKALGGTSATFGELVTPLIQNVLIICGVGALFFLVFAGFNYITAGGDKGKIENAGQAINYAIIGLVLIAVAYLITLLVGKMVGINIFNPS